MSKVDGRRKRRQRSREAIEGALERLRNGKGRHPHHAGLKVTITKQAVAREAGVSSATLYRFPDLVREIQAATPRVPAQRVSPSIQRIMRALKKIEELERDVKNLLSENFRLMMLLEKYDKTLGHGKAINLEAERIRRRRA